MWAITTGGISCHGQAVAEFRFFNVCAKINSGMQAAPGGAVWGGVWFVKLVIRRTDAGTGFVVEDGSGLSDPVHCEGQNPHSVAKDATRVGHPQGFVIPWLCAAVDPCEKWWLRLRGNPKRAGEISQAAFLLKAEMMRLDVALPWGDNQKFDFVVWRRDGRAERVQVKGTGRLHRRGYEVQPVHTTRRGGKKRYTKKDIDVIAAHVQPVDAWYLIPIEKVGRAKSLRLYPGIETKSSSAIPIRRKARTAGHAQHVARWERWRDAWDVIAKR